MPHRLDPKTVFFCTAMALALAALSTHLIDLWQAHMATDDVARQFYLNQRFAVLGFAVRLAIALASGYLAGRFGRGNAISNALLSGLLQWLVAMLPFAAHPIAFHT